MTARVRVKTRIALLGLACLLATVALAGVVAWLKLGANREPDAAAHETPPGAAIPTNPTVLPRPRPPVGSVLGRFDVPALKMSWTVLEGTDDKTLDLSVGHITGTALPGEPGNIGLAAHRNTHFRKMEWIRHGDEIVLTSPEGTFRYRVNYMKMHKPTDVDVLDSSHGSAVTLVTCFPFEYVGSAPLRFIVRAVAVEETQTRLRAAPGRTTAAAN